MSCQLIFSDESPLKIPTPNSLFLAGPTPRSAEVKSWRPAAIEILQKLNYSGTICIPERRDWTTLTSYEEQVEWEHSCLFNVESVVFWVPRSLPNMLGLTTNVEFGFLIDKTKVIYGRPDGAFSIRYLDWLYTKVTKQKPFNNLELMLKEVL